MRTRRWLVLIALAAAVTVAVFASGDLRRPAAPSGPSRGSINRLLVLGEDGNLSTLGPGGDDRAAVTSDAADDMVYAQPTWSPTSERIAFAETGGTGPALVTTLADGRGRTEARTATPPFYIHWSPGGDRLVFLANALGGIDLRLVDIRAGGNDATIIATGAPFYLSWAADGRELLTHVGSGGLGSLGRLRTDGRSEPLPGPPGFFQAPQWSQAGDRLIYALADGPSQRLVVADTDGAVQQEVARFDGVIAFALDPTGDRLAFTVRDAGDDLDEDVDEDVEVVERQPADRVPAGAVVIADLTTGEQRAVGDDPAVVLQWSPDGDALLFAALEAVSGTVGLRWRVWDGEGVLEFVHARPTATFAQEYLPFFDQYSRSLTLWSPNGDAFTYTGQDDDGANGIWVQPVAEDAQPERVSDGRFASWSPR